jgi:peptide/nickel transport system substrate-binding protein
MQFTSNELIGGDWTKGPQGTGDTDWALGWLGDMKVIAPELCDWELPDDTTIIWKLKKGVKFQNKAPAFGREMTADDLIWNFEYQFNNEGTWQNMEYPVGNPLRPVSWKALDRYTVEVKFQSADAQSLMLPEMGDNMYFSPPEVWTSGGDMNDWKKAIGSGPWILTDYVSGSYVTYTKNPDYFESDPIYASAGLNYRWPYLDNFKQLIIVDTSSRIAALRTAKIDFLREVDRDDAAILRSQIPSLKYKQGFVMAPMIAAGKLSQAPFNDIRVRRAMNMAVNKQEIVDKFYEGEAALVGYHYPPGKSWEKVYTPFDELPKDVQDLFKYDPARAKQLLAEAGYPDGFKTKITCTSDAVDELSIVKADLAKVNIDMELNVLEGGAWYGVWSSHQYDGMLYAPGLGSWEGVEILMTRKGMFPNFAEIDDPYFDELKERIARYVLKDPDKMLQAKKEANVYELSLAWGIFMPAKYQYILWWPWLENYEGVNWTGGAGTWDWTKAIWLNQDLKKSMGY